MDPDALQSEVDEWVRDDIISESQAEEILSRYDRHDTGRSRAVIALSAVGSALVFVGVSLFLATNWDDLPTAAQIAVLLAGPGLAYASGAIAYRYSIPRAGLALSLLGALLVGPSSFLLVETVSVDVAAEWLLFAWTAVALSTGHALDSRVGVGFGLAILAVLVVALVDPADPVTAVGLLGIALFALAGRYDSSDHVGWMYRIVGSVLVLLSVLLLTTLDGRFDRFDPGRSPTLFALVVGSIAAPAWLRWRTDRTASTWVTVAVAAVAAGTGAALAAPSTIPNWAGFGVVHLASLAVVGGTGYYGYRTGSRPFVDLAAVAALAQTLSFVAATIVDALSGSIALVVAGAILIAAGVALERGRRSILARVDR